MQWPRSEIFISVDSLRSRHNVFLNLVPSSLKTKLKPPFLQTDAIESTKNGEAFTSVTPEYNDNDDGSKEKNGNNKKKTRRSRGPVKVNVSLLAA